MEKSVLLDKYAHNEADRILLSRVYDRIFSAYRKNIPGSTSFLTKREQLLTGGILKGINVHFVGGVHEAERAVCCYLPDYLDECTLLDPELSPICAVRAQFYEADCLGHRDFLGSLMGIGIKRETVGDIYVSADSCDFFVTREIMPYILQNFESVGRSKVRLMQIPLDSVQLPQEQTQSIHTTVSALRCDSIVAAGFGLSRGKAAEAVLVGRVYLNDMPETRVDRQVVQGDKLSFRGMGKIVLETVGGRTKKNRIGVVIRRYG